MPFSGISVVANGDITASRSASAGVMGPGTTSGSLTPKKLFRVRTFKPGRFTFSEILCSRGVLPGAANEPAEGVNPMM